MTATGRKRVDPHRIRAAMIRMPSGRLRADRTAPDRGLSGASSDGAAAVWAVPAAPERPLRIIADPKAWVLAIPDLAEGKLSSSDRDMLGAARQLADAAAGAVAVLAFGPASDDLGLAGADRVLAFEGDWPPEARAAVIRAAAIKLSPAQIVFCDSAEGGDVGRRTAAAMGERAAAGVWKLGPGTVTSRGRGGRADLTQPMPRILLVQAEIAEPAETHRHEARPLGLGGFAPTPSRITDLGPVSVDPAAVPLHEAEFILACGNGVTDLDNFRACAQVLGATEGASRVIVDAGKMPRGRQVGSSGTIVNARVYVAIGISGASQHLQGIASCGKVAAINTDASCDMVKRADLSIIGDANAIMRAVVAERDKMAAAVLPLRAPNTPIVMAGLDPAIHADVPERPPEPSDNHVNGRIKSGHDEGGFVGWVQPTTQGGMVGFTHPTRLWRGGHESPASGQDPRVKPGDDDNWEGLSSPLRVAVLVSAGRHPASGRARRAPGDARAVELALGLPKASVTLLHTGDPDEPALRDYLGMGLPSLTVLGLPSGADAVPALIERLRALKPDLILTGACAESGEDSGLVPYLIAEALGLPIVPNIVALTPGGGAVNLLQARTRGQRQHLRAPLPLVATVDLAAPAPRAAALGPARRGLIHIEPASAPAIETDLAYAPARRRGKRLKRSSGTGADRFRAATESAGGGGKVLRGLSPEEAARALIDFLKGEGAID